MVSIQRALVTNSRSGRKAVAPGESLASRLDRDEGFRALDRLIEEAAAQITRLEAPAAHSAACADAVIIDIRSQDARRLRGIIPGSIHIPRTVLEWRIAMDSPWRNPHLGGLDQELILICDHGYSSILAATNLVQLGFDRAGDVLGGFEAWEQHDLPIAPCSHRLSQVAGLPGMGPPQ
jgi:rhodanese-related sulfurtransferase